MIMACTKSSLNIYDTQSLVKDAACNWHELRLNKLYACCTIYSVRESRVECRAPHKEHYFCKKSTSFLTGTLVFSFEMVLLKECATTITRA